jgi:hypothetical protein
MSPPFVSGGAGRLPRRAVGNPLDPETFSQFGLGVVVRGEGYGDRDEAVEAAGLVE